ncbi:MAG TPA: hypothetical protein VD906_15895 [Caulobacteraceae bacterium]|nr:hypothetical protein [Caulobacteraceae bacterium]
MKYVRLALGALLALYTAMGLYNVALTIGAKSGLLAVLPAGAERYQPLVEAIQWWQVIAWLVATALYAVAAWRLLRGGRATLVFLAGFVVDTVVWLSAKAMPAHRQVFSAQEQQMEYILMGAVLVGLVLTWWTEREQAPTAAAA